MAYYTRRDFVKIAAAGTGGLLIPAACMSKQSNWSFFTGEEAVLMEAVASCLIPAGEFPGAKEANVVNFIDRQLRGYHKRFQNNYRTGLSLIKKTCVSRFAKSFPELSEEQQVSLLKSMEDGSIEGDDRKDFSSRDFFNLMLDHTMQGFYGSPRHGGNRDYASYHMLELDYPLIIGRNKHKEE